MADWPVTENGLWILLAALGLWVATFVALFRVFRKPHSTFAGKIFRKTLLFIALLVPLLVFWDAIFGLARTDPMFREGVLIATLGAALLTALDRSGYLAASVTLPAWYAALILLTGEGVLGTFLVEPLVPATDRAFQRDVVEWWPYDIEEEKDPDTFRILALGDSFGRVHEENNYHFLVHREFQSEGMRAEVLNFSISGIEPTDQLKLLRLFGAKYAPDLVLQNFFIGNDFYIPPGEFIYFGGIYVRHHDGFAGCRPRNFLLVNWIASQWKVFSDRAKRQEETKTREKVGTFSHDEFLRIERDRVIPTCGKGIPTQLYLQGAVPVLDKIHKTATQIGAMYAVAVIPDQFQVDTPLLKEILEAFELSPENFDLNVPQAFLGTYCAERKIPFLDLREAFQKDGRGGELFLLRDTHFNEEGNAIVAEEVHRFLTEIDKARRDPPNPSP